HVRARVARASRRLERVRSPGRSISAGDGERARRGGPRARAALDRAFSLSAETRRRACRAHGIAARTLSDRGRRAALLAWLPNPGWHRLRRRPPPARAKTRRSKGSESLKSATVQ